MKRAKRKVSEIPPQPEGWTQCYCGGMGPRLTVLTSGMFQGPVYDHFRNAGVEVLLGLRAILDAQIDAMTRKAEKGTKVPVE